MVALTCTLKFGLKWSYHLQNIFANPFEFYGLLCVIKLQFCGCAQNIVGLVHVGITLEFLLNSAKLDMRKNGIANPRRNYPVSIAERTVNVLLYFHYNTYNVQ